MMKQLERFLFWCSLACLTIFAALLVEREWFQFRYIRDLSRVSVSEAALSPSQRRHLRRGEVLGRIEIPRLGISAAIADGDDDRTLRRAVGHVPRSAYPGEKGRVVLAAHRDTFFRELEWVRKGDRVQMITAHGWSDYVVESTVIVRPTSTQVIEPSGRDLLTLVTCYPFEYVGRAPFRFIVHARKVAS